MSLQSELKLIEIQELLKALIELMQEHFKQSNSMGIVTQRELLKLLNISPNTLKSWEKKGLRRLEPPIEGTRSVYYKLSDVLEFLTN